LIAPSRSVAANSGTIASATITSHNFIKPWPFQQ